MLMETFTIASRVDSLRTLSGAMMRMGFASLFVSVALPSIFLTPAAGALGSVFLVQGVFSGVLSLKSRFMADSEARKLVGLS